MALGPKGADGFLFVSSSNGQPVIGIIASTVKELTEKTANAQTLVQIDPTSTFGVDMPYGPTITSQALNSTTGTGDFGLRVSQFWKTGDATHAYDPRVYNTTCTIQ